MIVPCSLGLYLLVPFVQNFCPIFRCESVFSFSSECFGLPFFLVFGYSSSWNLDNKRPQQSSFLRTKKRPDITSKVKPNQSSASARSGSCRHFGGVGILFFFEAKSYQEHVFVSRVVLLKKGVNNNNNNNNNNHNDNDNDNDNNNDNNNNSSQSSRFVFNLNYDDFQLKSRKFLALSSFQPLLRKTTFRSCFTTPKVAKRFITQTTTLPVVFWKSQPVLNLKLHLYICSLVSSI